MDELAFNLDMIGMVFELILASISALVGCLFLTILAGVFALGFLIHGIYEIFKEEEEWNLIYYLK